MFDFLFKFSLLMAGNIILIVYAFLSIDSIFASLEVMYEMTKERIELLKKVAYYCHVAIMVVISIIASLVVENDFVNTIDLLMVILLGNILCMTLIDIGNMFLLRKNSDRAHEYYPKGTASYEALNDKANDCGMIMLLIFIFWQLGGGIDFLW